MSKFTDLDKFLTEHVKTGPAGCGVAVSKDGEILLDKTGRLNGRGAYICNDLECLRKARKSRRIDRTFEITIPDDVYNSLEEQIKNND